MNARSPTWAVVNAATTGLSPREHRIAEIAVVVLDEHGAPLGEASTLVDPAADLGMAEEHGIRPEDVRSAPRFAELTGWLAQWLRGNVLVGHNLLFLTAFLDEEFRRAGVEMPHIPAICTMTHAPRYLPSLPGRTLEQCCAAAGIAIDQPRTALTDARAAAALFAGFLAQRPVLPSPWEASIIRARRLSWPDLPVREFRMKPRPEPRPDDRPAADTSALAATRSGATPSPRSGATPSPRSDARSSPRSGTPSSSHHVPLDRGPESTSDFVVEVVDSAPRQPDEPATVSAYLGALDTAVSDRVLSFTEAIHLKDLAGALAIFEAEQHAAHRAYLRTLAATAWADHVVTDEERADLVEVGRLLDVGAEEVRDIIAQARPPATGRSPVPVGAGAGRRARATQPAGEAEDQAEADQADETYEPGWYTDPSGEHRLRWYDGSAWTEHTHA